LGLAGRRCGSAATSLFRSSSVIAPTTTSFTGSMMGCDSGSSSCSSMISNNNNNVVAANNRIAVRNIWVDVVKKIRYDPYTKKQDTFENPRNTVRRVQTPKPGKREHLRRHVKPTTRKRELNEAKVYYRRKRQVKELVHYIKFAQDHKDKDHW